jgi:dienelactone hydrolase
MSDTPKNPNRIHLWFTGIKAKPLTSGLSVLGILVLIWLLGSFYLYTAAPSQIFRTERSMNETLPSGYEQTFINTKQEQAIELWQFDNPRSEQVILYLHGNSGRIPYYFTFLGRQTNVLAPAYPGFGMSPGSPNVNNVYDTALASYDWLVEQGYDEDNITIFGHSLGGTPATYVAKERPNAQQLILVAAFDSIQSMCWDTYSILCAFGRGIFNTAELAKEVTIPVRQYHLRKDTVIPFANGEKLHSYFESTDDKQFTELSGETHSYFYPEEVFGRL